MATLSAQISNEAIHLTPDGKGWGVETEAPREGGTFGNKPATTIGMGYHRGPAMHANPVNVYFIWYGNGRTIPSLQTARRL